MELHQTGKVADWHTVPRGKRTFWQRLASSTRGWVTPGNAISLAGAIISIGGFVCLYYGYLETGFVAIAVGRLADILDGYVAHHTGTKSSLGETVDAGLDKTVILAAFLVFASTDIVPLWLIIILAVQQLVAASLGGYARLIRRHMHPSRLGKYAMAGQWVVLLGYILSAIVGGKVQDALEVPLAVALLTAIALGVAATAGYAHYVYWAIRNEGRKS